MMPLVTYYYSKYRTAAFKTIRRQNFAHFCLFGGCNCILTTHIPYEGEIAQTDLLIPFNQIDLYQDRLPEDKN
jgi:hypothetical protein